MLKVNFFVIYNSGTSIKINAIFFFSNCICILISFILLSKLKALVKNAFFNSGESNITDASEADRENRGKERQIAPQRGSAWGKPVLGPVTGFLENC